MTSRIQVLVLLPIQPLVTIFNVFPKSISLNVNDLQQLSFQQNSQLMIQLVIQSQQEREGQSTPENYLDQPQGL